MSATTLHAVNLTPGQTIKLESSSLPGGVLILQASAPLFRQAAGTTDTILSSDNLSGVQYNNASPITVTVPARLGIFSCTISQFTAAQVTLNGGPGVTINGLSSVTLAADQYTSGLLTATAPYIFTFNVVYHA